jgi:hypothetical protein
MVFVLVALLSIVGCFQEVLLNPEGLRDNTEDAIVVSLKDGRRVRFGSDDYSVFTDSSGRDIMKGNGKVYHLQDTQFESFEGDIPLSEIDKVTTSEKTTMFYLIIAATGLTIAYIVAFSLALGGRGFGG